MWKNTFDERVDTFDDVLDNFQDKCLASFRIHQRKLGNFVIFGYLNFSPKIIHFRPMKGWQITTIFLTFQKSVISVMCSFFKPFFPSIKSAKIVVQRCKLVLVPNGFPTFSPLSFSSKISHLGSFTISKIGHSFHFSSSYVSYCVWSFFLREGVVLFYMDIHAMFCVVQFWDGCMVENFKLGP